MKQLEVQDFFENRFWQAAQRFKAARQEELSKKCRVDFLVDTAYFLGFIAIIFAIFYLSVKKCILVGDIAAVMVTVRVLMSYLDEIFNEKLAGIVEAYPGLKNLHEVLEMTSGKVAACTPEFQKIELKDVQFRYPACKTFALDGINLTIHSGETICIVGENGSGKTTLSKILSGIYMPTSGTIQMDDHVFTGEESAGLRNISTSVFQDFQKYAVTLEENIFFGHAGAIPKIAEEVAKALPKKEKTILSKQFGGVDLSQGQWQRIAISRGIEKDAPLIIFDEPTSAIDPLLEKVFFEEILRNSGQRTKIIVTHRLGVATQADRIVVMDRGKIVQEGDHNALIQEEGIYKQMFDNQSKWYH